MVPVAPGIADILVANIFPLINGGFHQTQRRTENARGMPKLWQDLTTPKFVIQAHLQSTEDTGADRSKMRPEAQTTAAEGHETIVATSATRSGGGC